MALDSPSDRFRGQGPRAVTPPTPHPPLSERADDLPRRPIVKSAESARAGVISGRVLTVLAVSLLLAAMLSAAMLYLYRGAAG